MWIERYWRTAQGVPYPPIDPQPYEIPREIEERLEISIEALELWEFEKRVKAFLKSFPKLEPTKENLLYHLATALYPWSPNPNDENDFQAGPASNPQKKTNPYVEPGREISPPPIHKPSSKKQPSGINPDLKNLPSFALVKHYALVRKTTVFDFILEQSRSLSYARVHDFIQHNENYSLSSRGKGVYNGSFAWIARELRVSMRTVWGAFHWMAERKLVTKIGAQDHRIKKNSRWYVCTSMAQNLKLWSTAYQEKKG